MASKVVRVTLFKIPSKASQEIAKELYTTLASSAQKDGKPYILSLEAGAAYEDARSQGYTFVAKSEFKNIEDMRFYDTDCPAHKVFKEGAKPLGVEGVMTIYYEPSVVNVI